MSALYQHRLVAQVLHDTFCVVVRVYQPALRHRSGNFANLKNNLLCLPIHVLLVAIKDETRPHERIMMYPSLLPRAVLNF